jgi:hypothetical protein
VVRAKSAPNVKRKAKAPANHRALEMNGRVVAAAALNDAAGGKARRGANGIDHARAGQAADDAVRVGRTSARAAKRR